MAGFAHTGAPACAARPWGRPKGRTVLGEYSTVLRVAANPVPALRASGRALELLLLLIGLSRAPLPRLPRLRR